MKASELIAEIQNAINANGDLDVFIIDDGAVCRSVTLDVSPASSELNAHSETEDFPERLTLSSG
jgi:hypothetical protein